MDVAFYYHQLRDNVSKQVAGASEALENFIQERKNVVRENIRVNLLLPSFFLTS
jgi:hypothetical protein